MGTATAAHPHGHTAVASAYGGCSKGPLLSVPSVLALVTVLKAEGSTAGVVQLTAEVESKTNVWARCAWQSSFAPNPCLVTSYAFAVLTKLHFRASLEFQTLESSRS